MAKRLSFKNKLLGDLEKLKNGKINRDLFIDRYGPDELISFLREGSKNLSRQDILRINEFISEGQRRQVYYLENLSNLVN